MQRTTFLRMGAALLVAGALALAGCSDDNGGLSAEDMARIDNAEMAAASAMAAQAAAEAEAMAAEAEAAEAEAARMAAVAEAAEAMAAQMEAEAMAASAMMAQEDAEDMAQAATDARQDAETARDAAMAAQTEAERMRDAANTARDEANATIVTLEARVAELEAELAAGPATIGTLEGAEGRAAAARIKNATSSAPARNDALELVDTTADISAAGYANDPLDDTPYEGVPRATGALDTPVRGSLTRAGMAADDDKPDNHPEPTMTIPSSVSVTGLKQARLGQDAELTLSVKGGSGLGTEMHSAEMDAPEIDNFTGVSLMREGPGPITQMALVYSDAERSVRAWGDVYRYNVMEDGTPATAESNRTHLDVGDLMDNPVDLANYDSKVSFDDDAGLSTSGILSRDVSLGSTVRGSYDSVPGLFVCTGAAGAVCRIELNNAGTVRISYETAQGALAFRADNAEALLPDTDYLAFGVWTEVPDSPTLANPGRVQGFVHGSAEVFKYADVADLTGSASYSGAAVGHYATRAQGAHTVDMGRFTADAALTANFDADADPYAAGNDAAGLSLTGMITDFKMEDGTDIDGWVVNLNGGGMLTRTFDVPAADPADSDPRILARPSTDGDIYGATSGSTGSLSWSGVWDAWLFGNNTDAHPTGVAGRFQAVRGEPQPTTINGAINLFTDEGFAGVTGAFAGR